MCAPSAVQQGSAMDKQPKRAGYLAQNRQLNYLVALAGVVWAVMEWVSGSLVWFGGALVLIFLSVLNIVNAPSNDDGTSD